MFIRILFMIITWELALTPAQLGVLLAPGAQAMECPQGQTFNTSLNRCVLSNTTIDQKAESLACQGLSGSQLQDCVDANVTDQMSDATNERDDIEASVEPETKALNYLLPGIVTLGAGYVLFKKKDILGKCGSASTWLMLGGGVTSIAGEFLAQNRYKKKLDDITSAYSSSMQSSDNENGDAIDDLTQKQVAAFDFQIDQENARKKAHKARANTYNIAFGLYAAAAVAAIIEGYTQGFGASACETGGEATTEETAPGATESAAPGASEEIPSPGLETDSPVNDAPPVLPNPADADGLLQAQLFTPAEKTERAQLYATLAPEVFGEYSYIKNLQAKEVHEIILRKVYNAIFPSAYARQPQPEDQLKDFASSSNGNAPTTEVAKQAADASGADNFVVKALRNAWVRASIGGLLSGYSKHVANKAKKLAKISKNRVKLLKELRNDFLANGGAGFRQCSEADRRSPSKPFCFCYLENGSQNQARKDNEVCRSVFNSNDMNIIAGTYGKNTGPSEQGFKGCLRRNGIVDPGCSCRKEKNKSSGAACTSISGTLSLGNLASLSGLPNLVNDTAKFANGRISTGELAAGNNVDQLVSRINKKRKSFEKNPKLAPTLKKIDALTNKIDRQVRARVNKALASGALKDPFGGLGAASAAPPKSTKDVLAKTKNDIKALEQRYSKVSAGGKNKRNANFDFDLGGANAEGGVEISEDSFESTMKKKFSYNTIHNNSQGNIFKIITNRYHRSGFRRLFDDKGISEADAPDGKTIHGEK